MASWIAVDFDHTIVDIDKPLPGAKEALEKLKDMGYAIMIHSCNNKGWIQKVLRDNDIPYDYIWDASEDKGKPVCVAYIDDRGVGFNGDWNDAVKQVEDIENRRANILGTRGYRAKQEEKEKEEGLAGDSIYWGD